MPKMGYDGFEPVETEPIRDPYTSQPGCCGCCSIVTAAIITLLITTFDLVTDWLSYRHYLNLHIEKVKLDEDQDDLWSKVQMSLPTAFLAFCCVASVVYLLQIIWLWYSLTQARRKKAYGEQVQRNNIQRFGGEIVLFFQVLGEDAPIALIFFFTQFLASCRLQGVSEEAHWTFLLSSVATVISVFWKTLQNLWQCCTRCGVGMGILRTFSGILLLGALFLAGVNFVLFVPFFGPNLIFSHIGLESRISLENITFVQQEYGEFIVHRREQENQLDVVTFGKNRQQSLVDFRRVFMAGPGGVNVTLPCDNGPISNLLQEEHLGADGSTCTAVFRFVVDEKANAVKYNYGYRLQTGLGGCVPGSFQNGTSPPKWKKRFTKKIVANECRNFDCPNIKGKLEGSLHITCRNGQACRSYYDGLEGDAHKIAIYQKLTFSKEARKKSGTICNYGFAKQSDRQLPLELCP